MDFFNIFLMNFFTKSYYSVGNGILKFCNPNPALHFTLDKEWKHTSVRAHIQTVATR